MGTSPATAPFPLHPQSSTPNHVASRGKPKQHSSRVPPLTNSHISAGSRRTLSVATGGRWAKLTHHLSAPRPRPVSRRGTITAFSAKSRSRMIQSMCKLDTSQLPPGILFETLTYPRHYSGEPADWHRDLDVWTERFTKANPEAFFMWKLEFQKRGAPHFHLLIFGVGWNPKELERLNLLWRAWWYDIVGSGDKRHARRGAHLEVVKNVQQLVKYASKYVGKPDESIRAAGTGRIWGIRHRAVAPRTVLTAEISDSEFFALRRAFRRFMGARRGFFGAGGPDSGCWAALSSRAAIRYLEYLVAQAGGGAPVNRSGVIIEKQPHGTPGYPWGWIELGESIWAKRAVSRSIS